MWKEPSDTSSSNSEHTTPVPAATSASQSGVDEDRPQRVKVRITRPDGSSRDVAIAGHFREEHLCSLVDDELCRLDDGDSLVLHLFHPDDQLTHSLRNRWQEGMSDNRHVFVREVLGPNNDRQQLATQLRRIKERMAAGERVNLSIRSPRVAKVAREQLRKLLLISQQFEESLLNLWVHGDEDEQQKILGHLEGAGMVRTQDYEEFVEKHSDRRWRAPWIDIELASGKHKPKRRQRKPKTSGDAVTAWIKRVEEGREHH
jgi:hypothetical protein